MGTYSEWGPRCRPSLHLELVELEEGGVGCVEKKKGRYIKGKNMSNFAVVNFTCAKCRQYCFTC